MNKIIETIKRTLQYFAVITVGVTAAAAGYITFFYGSNTVIHVDILWQILIVSFICSLCQWFFYHPGEKEPGKRQFLFRWFLSYCYVNAVVLGFGSFFEWYDITDILMVLGMLVAILLVFVIVAAYGFRLDLKTAEEINRKLRERNESRGTE